jgi:hypothetical protein
VPRLAAATLILIPLINVLPLDYQMISSVIVIPFMTKIGPGGANGVVQLNHVGCPRKITTAALSLLTYFSCLSAGFQHRAGVHSHE